MIALARRALVCLILIVVVTAAGRFAPAQAPAQPPSAQTQPQPHSEQAYSLPPDKLAKAKTLNKIRLTLDIAGTFWGLLVLWWLLASRSAARLSDWTKTKTGRRWVQGLLFFAAFTVITAVASLLIFVVKWSVLRSLGACAALGILTQILLQR